MARFRIELTSIQSHILIKLTLYLVKSCILLQVTYTFFITVEYSTVFMHIQEVCGILQRVLWNLSAQTVRELANSESWQKRVRSMLSIFRVHILLNFHLFYFGTITSQSITVLHLQVAKCRRQTRTISIMKKCHQTIM